MCILSSKNIQAQIFETNPFYYATTNWVFGDSVWLTFLNDSVYSKPIDFKSREASSSFSDSSGKVQYYCSPTTFWNVNNNKKKIGFKGNNSSTQGSLILPTEGGINFFVSGENNFQFNNSAYHYVLNKYDSVIKVKMILNSSTEQLAAINHQNQRFVWVTTHLSTSDEFYTFLLKDNSLLCPVINEIGGNYSVGKITPHTNGVQIKYAPSGRFLGAARSESDQLGNARVDLVKVNIETAKLTENVYFKSVAPSRICFSPLETKFYANYNRITQVSLDLWNNADINASKFDVLSIQPFFISDLSISKSGVLFFSIPDSAYLGEISSPDSFGNKCNITPKAVLISSGKCKWGLPNFNASYFYTPSIDYAYTEDCWEHTYQFEGRDTFDADGYKWIFEKGTISDSILTKHCNYTFADTGKWNVSHIAWNTSRADTVTKTLTIRPKWNDDVLGKDTFYCRPFPPSGGQADSAQGDNKFTLTLRAPSDMHCVHWNGEESNLDDALGPIVDYDHFHTDTLQVDTAGTYIVKLTNKTFCQMYDTIVVEEKPRPTKSVVSRAGNQLTSSVAAAEYRWFLNNNLKLTTTNSKLIPDSNGYWRVQLISEFGCESELSDSFLVGFAGIDDSFLKSEVRFKVFPNPSDGKISIEVPQEGMYKIFISDMIGKVVYITHQKLNLTFEFELEFAKGTYLIKVTDQNGNTGSQKIEVVN